MSTSQPVSFAVRRAFWPFLPMAMESWSSSTVTFTRLAASSISIVLIFAGLSASTMNSFGSSLHLMMSTFSLFSSRTMFFTRAPRMPTHAPTGSTLLSALATATFVRIPASRAIPLSCTVPSAISLTSSWKSLRTKFGWLRDKMICGPSFPFSTATT